MEIIERGTIEIQNMIVHLPKFEQFEEGLQIRRSRKSLRSSIVEGYGRIYYKADFTKFNISALASNDEPIGHLQTLNETSSLTEELFKNLHSELKTVGRKINNFIRPIQNSHLRRGNYAQNPSGEYHLLNKLSLPASGH